MIVSSSESDQGAEWITNPVTQTTTGPRASGVPWVDIHSPTSPRAARNRLREGSVCGRGVY